MVGSGGSRHSRVSRFLGLRVFEGFSGALWF